MRSVCVADNGSFDGNCDNGSVAKGQCRTTVTEPGLCNKMIAANKVGIFTN